MLFASAQRLDGHYIPSRYPDAFPTGVPSDYYDEATAQQAIADARALLILCVEIIHEFTTSDTAISVRNRTVLRPG
jgi:HEPN domain-containing protein